MPEPASDKELFTASCKRSDEYPECLVSSSSIQRHNFDPYVERLNDQERRLVCLDGNADVDVWDYADSSENFHLSTMSSSFEMRGHFEGEDLFDVADPRCRFLFIGAPNSRDILRISRKMLTYMLTYYQVTPAFLDFVFQFGLQEYAQDFHWSGFREETHLLLAEKSLKIMELGRSGRDFRMCYSLKGVEQSDAQDWPWSVRETAAFHYFDVETGTALWILLKANELIKERVQSSTSSDRLSKKGSLKQVGNAFSFALETHLLLSEWSVENWRWYMNYLEGVLQEITGRSSIKVGKFSKVAPADIFHMAARRTMSISQGEGFQPMLLPPSRAPPYQPRNPLPNGPPPPPPVLPPGMGRPSLEKNLKADEHQDFSFNDLQQLQFIEEKMNEVLLVLDSNIYVLTELKEYYCSVIKSKEWPAELANDGERDFLRFSRRIASTIAELRMHHSRAETLLRVLGERKNLLNGILEYRTTQANMRITRKAQESTEKAQKSADRMEEISVNMHQIAKKTERETVSMRIITLVTLFFLPGTFMSTIFSTDIVRWPSSTTNDGEKVYQPGALILYLEITLPMMLLTFLAWGLMYEVSKRYERAETIKEREKNIV